MPNPRGRYWCFTLNNPTAEELEALGKAVRDSEACTYLGYGREVGECGTPHLQGYVEFSAKLRLGGVRKFNGFGRMHLELRKGTQKEAIDYCQKDSSDSNPYISFGKPVVSKQGRRSDLLSIQEDIQAGKSDEYIADTYFGTWVNARKSLQAYRALKNKRSARDIRVMVLIGAPGTGKTRLVFEHEPDLFISPTDNLQWFDGYDGEQALLIDDYRGAGDYSFLLRLLDRYPVQLPCKGSFTPLGATRIYITSNMDPTDWAPDHYEALSRRIHYVKRMMIPLDFENRELVEQIWGEISGTI